MDDRIWVDDEGFLVVSESFNAKNKLAFIFNAAGLESCIYLQRTSVESLLSFLVVWCGHPHFDDMDWWGEDDWT